MLCPHFMGTRGTERWGWPQALEEMAEPTQEGGISPVRSLWSGRLLVRAVWPRGGLCCSHSALPQGPGQLQHVLLRWAVSPRALVTGHGSCWV